MSREKDRAVLCAIGQIQDKIDLDDPKWLVWFIVAMKAPVNPEPYLQLLPSP